MNFVNYKCIKSKNSLEETYAECFMKKYTIADIKALVYKTYEFSPKAAMTYISNLPELIFCEKAGDSYVFNVCMKMQKGFTSPVEKMQIGYIVAQNSGLIKVVILPYKHRIAC